MNTFVLVLIMLVSSKEPDIQVMYEATEYETMEDCFWARELLIEDIGRPIINYQAVCVIKKY